MLIGSLLLTANEVLADFSDVYAMQATIKTWIFRSLDHNSLQSCNIPR